jgi:L-ascorbate metabolism protein UlaG (beta-lactamase superfamily)
MKYILALLVLAVSLTSISQTKTIDPSFDEAEDNYMNRQSKFLLETVDQTLKKYPPLYPTPEARTLGLYLLDAVLHDKYIAHREPAQKFYHERMANLATEIENTTVSEGMKIWKLYDMGFIVRTKSVTIAFDFISDNTPEAPGFALPWKTMQRLIDQCDVLFISHRHGDHASKDVAKAFSKAGKPIVAPSQVWENDPEHKLITHLKREAHTIQKLPIKNGKVVLDVVIYPGHQMKSHDNNVSVIYTPEGLTVSHSGDQINEGNFMIDYEWIDDVAKNHKVDVFLVNNWTNDVYRIVKGFDPKLVIPGHENEIGHTFDDRVPYWGDEEYLGLEYTKLKNSKYPVIPMVWGEGYHFNGK